MLLLSLLYDIREALHFKIRGFSRVLKSCFISDSQIQPAPDLTAGYENVVGF